MRAQLRVKLPKMLSSAGLKSQTSESIEEIINEMVKLESYVYYCDAPSCGKPIKVGSTVYMSADNKAVFCQPCGAKLPPSAPKPRPTWKLSIADLKRAVRAWRLGWRPGWKP